MKTSIDVAETVAPIRLSPTPTGEQHVHEQSSPGQQRQKNVAAVDTSTGSSAVTGVDLLGPADLCKVLRGWGCAHMNKVDSKVVAAQLISPGAGEGIARVGFEQAFLWWWQWDRTSAAQREATSASNGPGTGALPKTEEQVSRSRRKEKGVGVVPQMQLTADTSAVAYFNAQRSVIQASADSVRCAGRYPSLVAVLERIRRKTVSQYEEAQKEMKKWQRRNRHGILGGNAAKLPNLHVARSVGQEQQTPHHRTHERLAMQHRAVAAFKKGGQKLFAPRATSSMTLPTII